MRNLAVVFLCVAVVYVQCFTREQKETIQKKNFECLVKTAVEPALLFKLQSGDWNVEDKNLKRWVECMMKKSGLLSQHGTFQTAVALSKFPKNDRSEVALRLISGCVDSSLPPTELAWKFAKCYQTSNPKHSIF